MAATEEVLVRKVEHDNRYCANKPICYAITHIRNTPKRAFSSTGALSAAELRNYGDSLLNTLNYRPLPNPSDSPITAISKLSLRPCRHKALSLWVWRRYFRLPADT